MGRSLRSVRAVELVFGLNLAVEKARDMDDFVK